MHIFKFIILAAGVMLYSGCKKHDTQGGNKQEDDCVNKNSATNSNIIDGQYIVAYKPAGEVARASSQRMEQIGQEVLKENEINSSALKQTFGGDAAGFVAKLSKEEAQRLEEDPSIEAVEPDRVVALSTCFTIVAPTLITWNVNKVGYGNGIGKTAWIVDSGIDYDHPDLTVDTTRSRSFISGQTSATDENGHGTHVAGIIGAMNNNFGVLGIASGASLVSLRVLDKDGKGNLSSIILALAYVNANGKAGDVVNLSIGEDETSEILDQQVQFTASKGIYITIAAGNDGKAANLFSPGRVNGNNIYTVSAVDSLDKFASFSNFGNDVVDFAAPGIRILSTFKDGQYAKMSGTSMAAPHVAGLLLLNGGILHYSTTANGDPDGKPDRIVMK